MIKNVVKVKSDNFNGYMSERHYASFRLELSTGDFHTHEHALVPLDSLTDAERDEVELIDAMDATEEASYRL